MDVGVGVTPSVFTPGVVRGRVERLCVERECCGSSLVVEMPHLAFVRRRLAVTRPEDLPRKILSLFFLFFFFVERLKLSFISFVTSLVVVVWITISTPPAPSSASALTFSLALLEQSCGNLVWRRWRHVRRLQFSQE